MYRKENHRKKKTTNCIQNEQHPPLGGKVTRLHTSQLIYMKLVWANIAQEVAQIPQPVLTSTRVKH